MTENDLKYWKQCLKDVVPENLITTEVIVLRDQQNKMLNLMAKKNADYGNAFNKGCDSMGEAYGLCRMFDKANRFIKQASDKVSGYYNPNVTDESLYDTIQDLGNYCNMFMAWIKHRDNNIAIPFTGGLDDYTSINYNLRFCKGNIFEEDGKTDVTKEIFNTYNPDNLYIDKDNWVYSKTADGKYIIVTDQCGIQCIYKPKEKKND